MATTIRNKVHADRVSSARLARWVEGGNIAIVRALPHTSYQALLCLDDTRLLLNRTFFGGVSVLRPLAKFRHECAVKNVKQFCGELLDRCVPNHWKTACRQVHACLRTRIAIASSLFSLRKLLPGDKPSVREYEALMSQPQEPPSPDFSIFVSKVISEEFPVGWDRQYWRRVRSFTPPTKSNLDKKEKGTYRARAVAGDKSLSREAFSRWAGGVVTSPLHREVKARAVESSGKWRVITLSEPMLANLLPLHQTLYNHLSTKKWLLRGEAKPSCFDDFGRHQGEVFVSGDYEGATNNLNQHVSKLVLRLVLGKCTHVPLRVREEAMAALSPLFRVSGPGYTGLTAVQRGQLMGSPLSFPLLCLINYLTFRYLIRREVPVKINGDDIVFRSTPSEADAWFSGVSAAGLVVSPGKTLVNSRFFSLNSTYFLAADRGAGLNPHFRTSCLFRKCEDVGALVGRVAQIKRDLARGEIREAALTVLLRKNLTLVYSSQGSFSRRMCCPIPRTVLKRLRLDDRESFYRSLPFERELPSRYCGFRQTVVPESWRKDRLVYRGERRVPEDEVRDTFVSASWTASISPETKDQYFERLREGTYRYSPFSSRMQRLYAKVFRRKFKATVYPPFPNPGEKFWVEKECEGPGHCPRPVAFRSGGVIRDW